MSPAKVVLGSGKWEDAGSRVQQHGEGEREPYDGKIIS
jgi:hypothetical protein